jgi:copper transport protein
MIRRSLRPALAAVVGALVMAVGLVVGVAPAAAHNAFESAEPADGGSVTAGETVRLRFTDDVPLDTVTVELIDTTNVRRQVSGLGHGAAATEIVVPIFGDLSGAVRLRWRLVSPDGHVVSGRLTYTVQAAAPAPAPAGGTTAPPATAPGTAGDAGGTAGDEADPGAFSTPDPVRWLLRAGSYLGLLAAVGILVTTRFVWAGALGAPGLHRVPDVALAAVAVLALGQLFVLAGDIAGQAPWSASDRLDTALRTDAGRAFAARAVLALGALGVLVPLRRRFVDVTRLQWAALGVLGVGLLATWALAGHAWSMRWAVVGVPLDVVHHGAAAAWLGGLVVVARTALPHLDAEVATAVVGRFSRLAGPAVAALALTGFGQTVRLVTSPSALLDPHGRLLLAKLVVVAAMLWVANRNRQRVLRWCSGPVAASGRRIAALRRAMTTEFVVGLAVLAITAILVVTTPA